LFVIFLLVIVCPFSFAHCLSFFFWSLFVIFLLLTKRKMTNNEQKKNDKQRPKEKGQTKTKRKMTNNDQKKNVHCLSFFFWSLFVIFLLVIVCYFSFGHCLSFFLEK
jgi:Ca2+/Na+ antiporter